MIPTTLFALASAALASIASAAPVIEARANNPACYTTRTGVLLYNVTFYGLNSDNQVVWPSTDAQLDVQLQACPGASYASFSSESYGARLVSTVGSNQCLTTLQSPSDSNTYYMALAACGSNVNPPTSQAFFFNTTASGGSEIWHIENGQKAGPAVNANGPITTSGTHLVKFRHTEPSGEAHTPFVMEQFV